MTERVHKSPNLIYSVGTQVVIQKPVHSPNGRVAQPQGAVGVITRSPRDRQHSYRIRFPDGVETTPERVLVVRRGALGDSILFLPVLAAVSCIAGLTGPCHTTGAWRAAAVTRTRRVTSTMTSGEAAAPMTTAP